MLHVVCTCFKVFVCFQLQAKLLRIVFCTPNGERPRIARLSVERSSTQKHDTSRFCGRRRRRCRFPAKQSTCVERPFLTFASLSALSIDDPSIGYDLITSRFVTYDERTTSRGFTKFTYENDAVIFFNR